MKMHNKLIFLLPLIALTSCGYGLKNAVYGDTYNSPVFDNNFYTDFDSRLMAADDIEAIKLDNETNYVFTSYGDHNFVDHVDPARARSLEFWNFSFNDGAYYGKQNNLSLVDESFNYGYASKLFDGRMFCGGKYQLSRVQIKEQGFGLMFKKEIVSNVKDTIPYFAMCFKASVDYTNYEGYPETQVPSHYSDINLHVSLYCENQTKNKLEKHTYSYPLSSLETNHSDHCENNGVYDIKSNYVFFGFSLEKLSYEHCIGISITFSDVVDVYYNREQYKRNYSLMVYEIFLSNLNWN